MGGQGAVTPCMRISDSLGTERRTTGENQNGARPLRLPAYRLIAPHGVAIDLRLCAYFSA